MTPINPAESAPTIEIRSLTSSAFTHEALVPGVNQRREKVAVIAGMASSGTALPVFIFLFGSPWQAVSPRQPVVPARFRQTHPQ
jgi:hypothetical protein